MPERIRERRRSLRKVIMTVFLLLTGMQTLGYGQGILEVKIIALTGHLRKNNNPHLFKLKLDKKGRLTLPIGVALGVEYFLYQNHLAVKFVQSFMLDCGFQPAGFTHLGFRLHVRTGRHALAIGNGPTLFYRRDWSHLPNYVDEGLFRRAANCQYIFIWYAGEVEYIYTRRSKPDFSLTFIPGPPIFFTIAPGWRFVNCG
jgi:hypothetical protein